MLEWKPHRRFDKGCIDLVIHRYLLSSGFVELVDDRQIVDEEMGRMNQSPILQIEGLP